MDNETREYTLEEIYNNLNDYVTAEEAKGKDMMFQRVALNVFKLKLNEGMQKVGRWIYKERNILINTGRVSYGENEAVQEKRWTKAKKPYCSECGWYENSEYEATPYCPNCGSYNGG